MNGFCFKEKIEIVVRNINGEIQDSSVIERTPKTISKKDADQLISAKLEESLSSSASPTINSEEQ